MPARAVVSPLTPERGEKTTRDADETRCIQNSKYRAIKKCSVQTLLVLQRVWNIGTFHRKNKLYI